MLERSRMESELAQLELIRDPEQRTRVPTTGTLGLPLRWVCWLRRPEVAPRPLSFGAGTGVLIGPRHVLTAAHVLVEESDPGKTVGNRLMVQIARNGTDAPFHAVKVRGWQVDPRAVVRVVGRWRRQPQFDYGLVTLKEDVSGWSERRLGGCTLSWWGAANQCGHRSQIGLAVADVAGQDVEVTGHPYDKPRGTMWTASGQIQFDNVANVLRHTADTLPGQSGAPIWLMENGAPRLVGVHSGPGALRQGGMRQRYVNNVGVLLTHDIVQRLESWKQTFR